MSRKLKIFFLLCLQFILVSLPFSPQKANAYIQTPGYCKAQGAAYHFYWMGDYCWDLFQANCVMGKGGVALKMGMFLFSMATNGGLDVGTPLKATFFCAPLIDQCIVPELKNFEWNCKDDNTYYAPNLTVTSSWIGTHAPGLIYDDENKTLTATVMNNGMNPAMDIEVGVTWGSTKNRDKLVSGGGTLVNGRIPMLRFRHAQQNGHDTPQQDIINWLVAQTNVSNYFPPDPTISEIPFFWQTTVPFTAPDGEFTKVIINVDPSKMIPEMTETDNTYILEVDKLPSLHKFSVDNLKYERQDGSLTDYIVSFDLENSGDLSGNAQIKWYEGEYEANKSTLYATSTVVNGKTTIPISQATTVDISKGSSSCATSKKMTLVIADEDGVQIKRGFSIPLFAGEIYGHVEDLKGKPIDNVSIKLSSGQTTTTYGGGYYHLKGIPVLGKITVTATHPEYSQAETKEVEMKFDDSKDNCHIEGLTHMGVNFVLKDQDVVFTITLKDTSGNPVNGHVLATNKVSDNAEISNNNFRLDKDINGTGELGALQPGEYMFTISAGNYKTMAQTVSAVPSNQNLEFILEPILGRSNDGTMVIQAPQLLWQWDRGVEILSRVSATKDGKRVMLYTTKNKLDTGKLYFLDATTGNQIKVNNISGVGGQSRACLDTSYDGNTTAIIVRNEIAKEIGNILTLFNNQGNEFAKTNYLCKTSGCATSDCSVSPDGFYIFPGFLINKSLYEYSRMEIEGIGGYSHMGYSAMGPLYFLHGNGLIAACKKHGDGEQCAQYVNHTEITRFSGLEGSIRVVDSSFNDQRVIFGGYDKLSLYGAGTKVFEKDVNAAGGQEPSSSISMGGQYIIYSHNEPKTHNADFKIVTSDNVDKTPTYNKDVNENVIFVHANDKGLFYLTERGKTLKYYQVGKYTTAYNPETQPTSPPPLRTTNLSIHLNGIFSPAGAKMYSELDPGFMYRADQSLTLNIFGNGSSLHILEGTIFSLDNGRNPILLKGQITADFVAPITIYAIKFDRFDLALFRTKLNQFWRIRTLPESEYFVVKNIHTKFSIKNNPNDFNVAVDNGQVSVLSGKTEKLVDSGKQITIDAKNKVTETNYIGSKVYIIITFILVLIASVLLFVKRNSPIGKKILALLKLVGTGLLIVIKKLVGSFWKFIKAVIQKVKSIVKNVMSKRKKQ